MQVQFTYQWYDNFIRELCNHGYSFAFYHNHMQYRQCVLLRHDVDFSLEKALEIAKLEKKGGAISTYFILLSTDFYNPASKHSLNIIYEIHNLGHEIGLHFDEVKYAFYDHSELTTHIEEELKVMSTLLGWEIKSVSMHRPSKATLDANYHIKGVVNSYAKEYFEEIKYVSDSRRCWREDVETIIATSEYRKLHILTHPFWYNNEEKTLKQSIVGYVNDANLERYYAMISNIRDLDEIMKLSEVLR